MSRVERWLLLQGDPILLPAALARAVGDGYARRQQQLGRRLLWLTGSQVLYVPLTGLAEENSGFV